MKAIFLAALLVLAVCAQDSVDMQKLQRMENSKFGRTMLSTLQLQVESGDPADDLIHMLQDQEDKLEEEQSIADEFMLGLQNQCVEDLATLVDEIAATRIRIQQLEDLLKELVPLRARKQEEQADLEEFQALIEAKLQEMAVAKQAKDAEWAAEAAEHDNLTAIITKAKNIIASALGGFLQTDSHMNVLAQVAQHFNNAKKQHFMKKSYNGIFRVFAQLATNAPVQTASSTVDRIIELCDDLLAKIAESRAIEKRDYDHWIAEYNRTSDALNVKLEETKSAIAKLKAEITVLNKRISMATQELEEQTVRLNQKIVQHDERESFCDNAGKQYAKEREERSDQKEIISDAIGLLMAKIRLLKQYVGDRVQTLERPIF